MSNYRPNLDNFIPLTLFAPVYEDVLGVRQKKFNEVKMFYGNFKTYGGTDRDVNGIYSVEDTGQVTTWYDPDISSECTISLGDSNVKYEILGTPENIQQRGQFMTFKVRALKGAV